MCIKLPFHARLIWSNHHRVVFPTGLYFDEIVIYRNDVTKDLFPYGYGWTGSFVFVNLLRLATFLPLP